MEDYSSNLAAISGLIVAIASIYGILHNRFLALHQFMSETGDPALISARHHVYSLTGPANINDEQTAQVINFYNRWGLMFKRHYLPRWIFNAGYGRGAVRLYHLCEPYIDLFRDTHKDDSYAKNYKWLCDYLEKRYARQAKINAWVAQLKSYLT